MNYLIVGQEHYLIKEKLKEIENGLSDYQKTTFDASSKKFSIKEVLYQGQTMNFFNSDQLIIVYNANFLKSKGKVEDDDFSLIEEYFKAPNSSVTLIFTLNLDINENIDTRKKIYKLLVKHTEYHNFEQIKANNKRQVIVMEMQKRNIKMSANLTEFLINRLPADLGVITNELDKLALWSNPIDEKLLEQMLPPYYEDKIFDLIKYIIQKNETNALKCFSDLLNVTADPSIVIYSLASQYRFMFKIKTLMNMGKDKAAIISELRQNPYYIENTMKQARLVSSSRILGILNGLAELDIKFKSDSTINKNLSLFLFLFKELDICNH